MTEEVTKLIEKSEHALEVAEALMKDGYPSDAASKVYYAMFYAAQALLKSAGIDVVKHSAVESAIGYHFAKTGKIELTVLDHFDDYTNILAYKLIHNSLTDWN